MQIRSKTTPVLGMLTVLICAIIVGLGLWMWQPWQKPASSLPTVATNQIKDFTPYYFTGDIPGGFTLVHNSTVYEKGVLFFQLQNNSRGQTISVSQQLLPDTVANNDYSKAETINGADGKAIISYEGTRAMAALFSTKRDGGQTLVLLTTSDPVAKETLADMLRGLRPSKQVTSGQ